jgi:hypothetical protein
MPDLFKVAQIDFLKKQQWYSRVRLFGLLTKPFRFVSNLFRKKPKIGSAASELITSLIEAGVVKSYNRVGVGDAAASRWMPASDWDKKKFSEPS